MSHWITVFEDHQLHTTLKAIKEKLVDLDVVDVSIISDVEEVARANKALVFIEKTLAGLDAELYPQQHLATLATHLTSAETRLDKYINNHDIAHITNLNAQFDAVLQLVRPYLIGQKRSAIGANAAFKAYSDTVEKSSQKLIDSTNKKVTHINDFFDKTKILEADIDLKFTKIRDAYNEIYTGDPDKNITPYLADIEEFKAESFQSSTEIKKFHEAVFTDAIGYKDTIEAFKVMTVDNSESIEQLLESVSSNIKDLNGCHAKILGDKSDDSDNPGLAARIERFQDQLKEYEVQSKDVHKSLVVRIEELLPGSTSAGLARTFNASEGEFRTAKRWYMSFFMAALTALLFFSAYTFAKVDLDTANWLSILKVFFIRLPVYLPLIWMATFFAKRRSECNRLEEEYKHKKTVASSYMGFKQQIENINDNDGKLLKDLLASCIDTIGLNAATSLTEKHHSNNFIVDSIKSVLEATDKKR